MFKNYIKIAWRTLFRNKGFSITNLLGLTIGITCTLLIFLWVNDELAFDKFQPNYRSVYQVIANRNFNNQMFTDRNMVFPMAPALEKAYPQIKNAVVTTYQEQHTITIGNTKLKKNGYTVSAHFFNVFPWKFIKGNPATALNDAYAVVLTQSAAKTFFGDEDPINKTFKIDDDYTVKVSAVVADPPGNSTFQFDYINTFNYSSEYIKRVSDEWQNSSWNIFLQVAPGANMAQLDKDINILKKSHDQHDQVSTYFTFPMSKWHLYSDFKDGKNTGGMIEYVRLFSIIAVIILLIACINFMNLSTARSEKRAKEVGIRKTLGSAKKQLIIQFFFESMILALIALVFSIIAVLLLLPAFNTLVSKNLTLDFSQPVMWASMLVIVIFTGAIAGSYPALYLSSFSPIKVLKGTFLAGKSAVLPRRILVVAQFVISILLISATIIVYQQIQHVKNRNIGYNPNNLIMVPSTETKDKNFTAIKNDLVKSGMVDAVTRTMSPITQIWWRSGSPDWAGKPANTDIIFTGQRADVDFTKTMGIKMLEGHDFSGLPVDSSSLILNKAAVETMKLKNPVGMQMKYGRRNYTVIGVMDNVVMESPYSPVDPLMVYYDGYGSNFESIRLRQGIDPKKALPMLEATYKKYDAASLFEYQFVDQEFGKKFLAEELISKITNIFAGLAIFICCIGLAGLASFTIEKRIREIGIRKVLGATVQQLLMLISKEFLKLVLVAFVIAVPVSWWLMSNWLDKYTYHINITIWLFAAVGVLILLLTLVVVSLNTFRAAMANPVKSLRTE